MSEPICVPSALPDEQETWRPALGHEGEYEVSDLGRVRSVERVIETKSGQKRLIHARVKQLTPGYGGYVTTALWRDGFKRKVRVHTLVLEAFNGRAPAGLQALHGDGNPSNNRLSNLSWGTPSENMWDRVRHGNHPAKNRTHCPREHKLIEPNLRPSSFAATGYRACWACALAKNEARFAKQQGREHDLAARANAFYDKLMSGWLPTRSGNLCKRNHQLAEPNLVPSTLKKGWRACLACDRGHNVVRGAKKRGQVLDMQEESDRAYRKIMGDLAA